MPEEMNEIIKVYEDVIDELCRFYADMEIVEEPIKIFEMFWYMCFSSYLSSGDFSYGMPNAFVSLEKDVICMDIEGSIVLTGNGCCRNLTDFLYHVYDKLGYESSQLFLYSPNLKSTCFLHNDNVSLEEMKRCRDVVLNEIDVFSKIPIHHEKEFGNMKIVSDYIPTKEIPNHTLNIVKSKNFKRIYIVDVTKHRIAEVIDEKRIRLSDLAFEYIEFVFDSVDFDTYYDSTDYDYGWFLLNEYDANLKEDLLLASSYRKRCCDFEYEYRLFKKRNKERFDFVKEKYQQLIKRMGYNKF